MTPTTDQSVSVSLPPSAQLTPKVSWGKTSTAGVGASLLQFIGAGVTLATDAGDTNARTLFFTACATLLLTLGGRFAQAVAIAVKYGPKVLDVGEQLVGALQQAAPPVTVNVRQPFVSAEDLAKVANAAAAGSSFEVTSSSGAMPYPPAGTASGPITPATPEQAAAAVAESVAREPGAVPPGNADGVDGVTKVPVDVPDTHLGLADGDASQPTGGPVIDDEETT